MNETQESIRPAGVLGVGLGLLVLLGLVFGVMPRMAKDLDAAAVEAALVERFELEEGLFLEGAQGKQLSKTDQVFTLYSTEDPEPDPLPFDGKVAKKNRGKKWDPDNKTEWGKVQLEEGEADPHEVTLYVSSNQKHAARILDGQFSEVRFKDLKRLSSEGEALPVNSGHIEWDGYRANWVHLRHYQLVDEVPTSHDTIRVNLTTGREARVLYVRWPRTFEAHLAPVELWLSRLLPKLEA